MASGTSGGKFSIYNVAFNAEGVPTLTDTGYTVSPGGSNLYDLTWDAAGNVYAGNAGSEYVKGYAVPRADNTFATKAASKYNFIVDTATGVETIGADICRNGTLQVHAYFPHYPGYGEKRVFLHPVTMQSNAYGIFCVLSLPPRLGGGKKQKKPGKSAELQFISYSHYP